MSDFEIRRQRESTSLEQLKVFERNYQLKAVDLCSHRFLLERAKIFPKKENNQTFMDDLQEMINLIFALQKELVQELTEEENTKQTDLLLSINEFISTKILKIEKCHQFIEYSKGGQDSMIPEELLEPEPDLDYAQVACQQFAKRIENCIEANTFEYIFGAFQLFILRFRDYLLMDCLQKERTQEHPLILNLLIICSGIKTQGKSDDKFYKMKFEAQKSLVYILNRVSHQRTLQMSIPLLEIQDRDWIYGNQDPDELALKMLNWAELTNYQVLNNLQELDDQIQINLDFEPEKVNDKEFEKFERVRNTNFSEVVTKMCKTINENSQENEIPSHDVDPPKKLLCTVSVSLKTIPNLPRALQAHLGSNSFSLTKEEEISFLRDGARAIYEHTYNQIRDEVIKISNLQDRILPWAEYYIIFKTLIEKGILPSVEAGLVLALQSSKSLFQFQKLGLNSYEQILNQNYYMFYICNASYFEINCDQDPLQIQKRKDNLINQLDLISICQLLVKDSICEKNHSEMIQNKYLAVNYWKFLQVFLDKIDFYETYNSNRELNQHLKKLLFVENENAEKKIKPYLLDLLYQANYLSYEGAQLNELKIKQSNEQDSLKEIFTKKVDISLYLLANGDFQSSLWKVARAFYYQLHRSCYRLSDYDSQRQSDLFKYVYPIKLELEEIAFQQLGKYPIVVGESILLNQNDVVFQICSNMIIAHYSFEREINRELQNNVHDQANFKKITELIIKSLKGLNQGKLYCMQGVNLSQQQCQFMKVQNFNVSIKSLFAKTREHLDNPGDNQANFQEAVAEIFSLEIFEIFYQKKESQEQQWLLSRVWEEYQTFFISFYRTKPILMQNFIEQGGLKKILQFYSEMIEPRHNTFISLITFLTELVQDEKGLAEIRESKIFEKYLMPATDDHFRKIAFTTSKWHYQGTAGQSLLHSLIVNPVEYFQQEAIIAFKAILDYITPKAKILQKKFYDHLQTFLSQKSIDNQTQGKFSQIKSYQQFLVEVTEQLADTEEYYLIKYELWKIRLGTYNYWDSNSFQIYKKIFLNEQPEITEPSYFHKFLDIYAIICTLKPAYEYQQQAVSEYETKIFTLFKDIKNILNSLIYSDEDVNNLKYCSTVLVFFEAQMKSLKELVINIAGKVGSFATNDIYIFESRNEIQRPVNELRDVNWIDLFQKIDLNNEKLSLEGLSETVTSEIDSQNLKGHLIARIQIINYLFQEYFSLDADKRKHIFQKDESWENLIKDFKGIEVSFIINKNQAKNLFYFNLDELTNRNYISKDQMKMLKYVKKEGLSKKQDLYFQQNANFQTNINFLRGDLLFFEDNEDKMKLTIQRLSDSWYYLGYYDAERNKKYTQQKIIMFNYDFEMTDLSTEISKIKEHGYNNIRFQLVMDYILQHTEFLDIVISRGQQDGKDFIQMIDEGKMAQVLNIYNFIKNLHPHSLSKEANFDKNKTTSEELNKCFNQFAFKLYNLICTKLKDLILKFTKQSDSLVTSDHIMAYDVYENQQEFFCNYFYQLIVGLLYEQGYKKSENSVQLQQSLQSLSSNSDKPNLDRFISENKDLNEVQLELMTCISNLFNKFSHLKYVEKQGKIESTEPPKKPHQDDILISQILDMGFNLKQAKKALKLKGEVEAAVTYLLEGDLSQLNAVVLTEDEEDILDGNFEDNGKQKLDETQIQLIVDMGVERKEARKALKFTGSVEAAIGLLFEGDRTLLDNVSDHEDEPEELKKEKRQKAIQKKIEERIVKQVKQLEKDLKREVLISSDQFYEFIDKIQRECFQITKQWYEDNKNTSKQQKYYYTQLNYLINYLKIDILPKNTSQQEILKEIYEQNFKQFQTKIAELQQFQLFGGEVGDQNSDKFLIEILHIFQLLFKLQNIPQTTQYFESIKQNQEFNNQAFQNSIYQLLNAFLHGKNNIKPEDFFYAQLELLKDKDEKFKVCFVTNNLQLIFRCLQMCRVYQQKYIVKFQKVDKKILEILKQPEKDQNIVLISKYQTKGYSYFREIQKISNKAWGEKILSYSLAYIANLKQFNLKIDDFKENQDLLLQLIDASQFIQAISDHVLSEFRQSNCLKHSNSLIVPSKFSQQINLDLETAQSNAITLQQTRVSGTLKILQMQNAILNSERLIDQLAYIMKKQLTLKAKKQAKYRLQKEKQKVQNFIEIQIMQKDSEIDLQKFINDFSNTVLGLDKDNYYAYKSKPISEESAKLFTEQMYKAVSQICEIKIPTNNYDGNIDVLNIMLKQEIIEQVNSKNEKDVDLENLKEIKLYENIMSQLVESGQFLMKKVEQSWSEDILLFENIYNWSLTTMLALRCLSCIARTSFDGKSGLMTRIENDFKENNKLSLLSWFKNIYLPIRLLGTHNFNVSNQEQNIQEVSVFLIADYNENLDKNVSFFLNELLGYGHLYSESAILQRKSLREQLLCSCLETLRECVDRNNEDQQNGKGYLQMPVIQQSQIIGSTMIVQYLINQYNNFEYNRVVQSRQCYLETIEFLLDCQSGNEKSLFNMIYDLQGQVQWLTQLPYMKEVTSILGKQSKSELLKKLNFITTQAFSSQLLDRISLIFSGLCCYESLLTDRQIQLEKSLKKHKEDKSNQSNQEDNLEQSPSQQQLDNQGPLEANQESSSQQIEEIKEQINQSTESQAQQPAEVQKVGHRLHQNRQTEDDDIIISNENEDDNNENNEDNQLLYNEINQVNEIGQKHIREIEFCPINDKLDRTNKLVKGIYPRVHPEQQSYISLNIVSNNQAFHIEYDILQHHIQWHDEQPRNLETIQNIQINQTKTGVENSVSHLLQILKPLSLQNFYDLGQIIEDRFFQIVASIDVRKKANEEKERNVDDREEEDYQIRSRRECSSNGYDMNDWSNYCESYRQAEVYGTEDRIRYQKEYLEKIEMYSAYHGIYGLGFRNLRNLFRKQIEDNAFENQDLDASFCSDVSIYPKNEISNYDKIKNFIQSLIDQGEVSYEILQEDPKVEVQPFIDLPEEVLPPSDVPAEVQPPSDVAAEAQPPSDVQEEGQAPSDVLADGQLPPDWPVEVLASQDVPEEVNASQVLPEEAQPPSNVSAEVQPSINVLEEAQSLTDVQLEVQPQLDELVENIPSSDVQTEVQLSSDNQITEQIREVETSTNNIFSDLNQEQPEASSDQNIQPIQQEENQIDSSGAVQVAKINGLIYVKDNQFGMADFVFQEPGLIEPLPVTQEFDLEFPKNILREQDFEQFINLPKRQSGSYISYSVPTWITDDGQRFPETKYFFESSYDSQKRKFIGWIDWTVEPYFDNGCFWQYSFKFSEDFQKVQSGYRVQRDKFGKVTAIFEFGNQLNYTLFNPDIDIIIESSQSKEPESLDQAQLIDSVKDPELRRELLLELTQEEVDDLPYNLKEELQRILNSQNQIEQAKAQDNIQEEQEQEKVEDLVDPNTLNLDQLLIENVKDIDQIKEDGSIQRKEGQNILKKLRNLKDGKNQDKLIRNTLQILIFQEFRNDTKNLITHLFSKKSDPNYSEDMGFKIKFMNSLVFLMKGTFEMNKSLISQFFGLSSELEETQLSKLSNQLWTSIFLKLSITLSNIIQEDPNLAKVLLLCFIQPEKYFYGKQDQLVSNVSLLQKDENKIQTKIFNPPFTTFMEIMLQDSTQLQKLEKLEKPDEIQQQSLEDTKRRSASVRVSVRSVLKQFNLLYNNQESNPKLGLSDSNFQKQAKEMQDKSENKKVSTFGLLSKESIDSLSSIGQLPSSNQKKMIQNLQKILFRTTQLSMVDLHLCNTVKEISSSDIIDQEAQDLKIDLNLSLEGQVSTSLFQQASNQAAQACFKNFNLIIQKQVKLGLDNLSQMVDIIWQINEITGCHDQPKLQQLQSFTKLEKTLSIQEALQHQISLTVQAKKAEITKKLSDDQRKDLKDAINQFKTQSTPFIQVLSTFNLFLRLLVQQKKTFEKAIKSITKQIEEKDKEKQRKTEELNKIIEQRKGNVGEKVKQIEKDLQKIQKEEEDSQKTLGFINLIIKLQTKQIKQLHEFYLNDELQDFIDQANQFLLATQKFIDDKEMIEEESKILFNIIFDSFYPEMLIEVINFKSEPKTTETESKFVKMEKIEKIQTEDQKKVINPTDSISLVRATTSFLRPVVKNNQLLVFKNEISNVSPRLERFNAFCLQNKDLLNKYIKNNWSDGKHQDIEDVLNLMKFMPNLLSFENKQTLFQKEIQKLRDKEYGYFEPEVRRTHLFEDSFQKFIFENPEKLKYHFKIKFENELGYDAGGVRRDFFNQISKQIFDQNLGLFQNSDNGSTYMPNPRSSLQIDYIKYFKFIGRIIAKAVFEKCMLECYFVSSVYKMIIGQTLSFKDLQDIDNNLYTGLNWCLLPSSDVEQLYETFSIDHDYFGQPKTIEIVLGGSQIDLTNENKEYYVERKAYYLLYLQVQKQMDAFLEGFYDVIPKETISIFTYKEIELLISGQPHYEISDLKANTEYKGYSAESPQIKWFWEIMETLNETDKASFLQFVTGSSKVPVGGFAMLNGMSGLQKFQISHISPNWKYQLPEAHTCYNQIDLPDYDSKEMLEEKLMWAIKEASGFGFG